MNNDNLKLWESVCETNPNDTKKVEFGRKFTAIDAYSQIKKATEQFGSYGNKWGLTEIDHIFIHDCPVVLAKAIFKYPDGQFPVTSSIALKRSNGFDDDFAKKVETDMITKALSRLGFNADVFMGLYDDNKYVQAMSKKFEQIDTQPINQAHVDGCYDMLKEEIDKSIENAVDPNFDRMKAGMDRITNDERMATLDKFGNDKPKDSKRKYTTLINDCLKHHPADDEVIEK